MIAGRKDNADRVVCKWGTQSPPPPGRLFWPSKLAVTKEHPVVSKGGHADHCVCKFGAQGPGLRPCMLAIVRRFRSFHGFRDFHDCSSCVIVFDQFTVVSSSLITSCFMIFHHLSAISMTVHHFHPLSPAAINFHHFPVSSVGSI